MAKNLKLLLTQNGHVIVKKNARATICIGGDGTILYAYHKDQLEGSVLGIGSDSSYICQLRKNNWFENVLDILAENKENKVMTLECVVGGKKFSAINDFVVHTKNYRVIGLEVCVPGKKTFFEGDGLIISSAIGSAAYAYSAGGEILKLNERKFEVVPICPYKRAFSYIILNEGEDLFIELKGSSALIKDGILIMNLPQNIVVKVTTGPTIKFFKTGIQ